ncbi:MAG TPA: TetR/AcrR family transcriptional regulator [Solirubrobacteraceae bacterium]|jgi:AcrR family transcriptional regulator
MSQLQSIAGFAHGRVPAPVRAEQLLDVAERLFAEAGYGGTSIETIAADAGVTKPLVYRHFGSKEGVYLACLRRARGQMEAMMAEAWAGAEGLRGKLEAGADAYFRFVESEPLRWRVLHGSDSGVPPAVAEEATQMHLATERGFTALLAGTAAADADPQRILAFCHAIGGAGHQLAQWWLRTPGISREQLVAWYCEATWSGVRALVEDG